MAETATAKDLFDMMVSVNEATKFAMRERTIAAALDIAIEKGATTESLADYERDLRKRVPLNA